MSAQDASGMPFEICANPQNLRLLELPTSLLDLIRSSNPPEKSLTLKSEKPSHDGKQQPAAHAVLCTDDRTFQVRQVQSSNSVYILQRTKKQSLAASVDLPSTALCAIAQCPSLLELLPTSPSSIDFLKKELSAYGAEQIDGSLPMTSAEKLNPWDKASKNGILEDAPFSAREFDQAWKEMCAFEHGPSAWFPTLSVLADVWHTVTVSASASGVRLEESFSISEITSTMEEGHYPTPLVMAVMAKLSADGQDMMNGHVRLDSAKCVSWVGTMLLATSGGGRLVSDFIKQWQDELPEAWREDALLEAINGKYSRPTSATIVYDEKGSKADSGVYTAPQATAKKVKPNWHEKLNNVKR